MPKRLSTFKRSAQAANRRAKAELTEQIKVLKRLGLVQKRQNLQSAIVRRNLRKKFKDVLQRKASVITVPKGFAAKLKNSFKVIGPRVVIPRAKGERVRVEKSGRITSTRKVGGKRVKRILHFGGKMPVARKGKKLMYSVPFTGGGRIRFDDLTALQDFMTPYHTYKNWRDYMEIEEVDADDDGGNDE